jgi:hypothetical protein
MEPANVSDLMLNCPPPVEESPVRPMFCLEKAHAIELKDDHIFLPNMAVFGM